MQVPEKKEYVKLWLSYASYFESYGAAEVGRLVLAMIKYRASGVEPEFSGSERFIWPAIKRDIDESVSAQESAAEAHRESGKKGGRPKNQKNQNGFQETKKSYGQRTKDKGQGQGQGQGQSSPDGDEIARAREASFAVVMSAFLDKISPTPSQTSLEELKGYVQSMGPEVCLRAIDAALDAKKASWSYIRGILRNKQSQGVRCLSDWDELESRREKGGEAGNQNSAEGTGINAKKWKIQSVDLD